MNSLAKNIWTIVLVVIVIPVAAYIDYSVYYDRLPCKNPITYKIGTVDPRFGVSQSSFAKDITQAGDIWSKAISKPLFQYDPHGTVTINLVYDTRQAATQLESKLTTDIKQTGQSASMVKQQYTALQGQYQTQQQGYDSQLAQFNASQDAYNSEVEYWNKKGGAPKSEYDKLQAEKSTLDSQRSSLESQRQELNGMAAQINTLIAQYNSLVGNINANVDTINNDGIAGTEFEEGVYVSDDNGQHIDIYQFDNQTAFIRVLAHELGHALGLNHDSGTNSIMNPVNQGTNLSLSSQDLAELKAQCRE